MHDVAVLFGKVVAIISGLVIGPFAALIALCLFAVLCVLALVFCLGLYDQTVGRWRKQEGFFFDFHKNPHIKEKQ